MDEYDSVLHAYVHSRLGRERWFLHERGNVPFAHSQSEMSFLQKRFLMIAADVYGPDESQMPSQSTPHNVPRNF